MKKWTNLTYLTLLVLLGLFLMACSSGQEAAAGDTATGAEEAPSGKIVIGEVSDDPAKKIPRYQPLADYLADHLHDQGIGVGEVKIAPDLATMTQWLKEGEVDIYFDSPYPAMVVSDASGAQPIVRRWKEGVEAYNSVIFVRSGQDIVSLEDLQGHIVGFEESYSTSGYFLPYAYLLEAGLSPAEKSAPGAAVAVDEVGYFFTGEDEATVQMVLSGEITAGALDSGGYLEIPEETRAELDVLLETEMVARHVGLANSQMSPELLAAVTSLLVNMDEDEAAQDVLEAFEETSQFDLFPEGLAESTLERMRELYAIVQDS